jgi:hypothetical protein
LGNIPPNNLDNNRLFVSALLQEHVLNLQREARFDEAEVKNLELAQLKDDEFVIAQKDLSSRQENEDKEFNYFARRLIDEFERRWDAEILQA